MSTSSPPESRLRLIFEGEGFGGDHTAGAKVIRELVDEIRQLRAQLSDDGAAALDEHYIPPLIS